MSFIIKFLLSALGAFALAKILPGVHINSFTDAVLLVLVLGVLNAIVKPVLKILTLPITILTLGLFLLVINVIIIQLADYFLGGVEISGFLNTLLFGFLLSLITGRWI